MTLSTYTEKDQRIIKLISDSVVFYSLKNKLTENAQLLTGINVDIDAYSFACEVAREYFCEERGIDDCLSVEHLIDEFLDVFFEYEDQFDLSSCISKEQHLFIAESIFLKWCEMFKNDQLKKPSDHEN